MNMCWIKHKHLQSIALVYTIDKHLETSFNIWGKLLGDVSMPVEDM